jgi:hypothetical protein
MRKWLTLFSLVFAVALVKAQETPIPPAGPSALRLGIGLFMVTPQGDLSHGEANVRLTSGANLSLQFASSKLISPQINAGFGRVVAQDRDVPAVEGLQPNTFAETPFFYVDFRLRAKFLRQSPVNPYFGFGIGMLNFSPRDAEGNSLIDNTDTRAEGETYGNMTVGFPITVGSEVRLSEIVRLSAEYVFRPTGSDYLDNVGQLGQVEGKDKMHQVQIALLITLKP